MPRVSATARAALRDSGLFDAAWYLERYPDVAALGMDPEEHYLTYGFRLDRDPGPGFSTRFARAAFAIRPDDEPLTKLVWRERTYGKPAEPEARRIVRAAGALSIDGQHDLAIAMADKWLPPDLRHTTAILRANAAIWEGDPAGWQEQVNSYLAHFGAEPLGLGKTGALFDRLACAPQPAVTGGPLVTVIMAAWNAAATVGTAVRSVLGQTWRNLELLIVDDCSTDETWSILQEIAATDSRIRLMRNTVNVGPYVSKNLALVQAKGDWITGHDADDWAHPLRLERQMQHALADTPRPGMVQAFRIRPDGLVSVFAMVGEYSIDGIARTAPISCMYPHALLREKAGYWDSVRFAADSEMISRVQAITGETIPVQPVIGMICLDTETSLTNDLDTGVSKTTGLSPMRLAYRTASRKWHAGTTPDDLRLELVQTHRRFTAPAAMCVPVEDILTNMRLASESEGD